jgi:hypothetical protein
MRDQFHRARILSFVTGLGNQELLRNEYLTAENRILRAHRPVAESPRGISPRGAQQIPDVKLSIHPARVPP